MNQALVVFATAGIVSLGAIATPAPAQARPWDPWPWPSVGPAAPGPLYSYRDVFASDALWDAYLRAREIAPYAYTTTYVEPAAYYGDHTIVRVGFRSGPRWHRRHHQHRD